ncbi:hypothetical protein HHL16_11005 [Pseudoflavitalea sp. G-6-1-2]|uniref:hypothetical protein n=1 Tax=Pseudoflavitalea sp. G-6-1-2 TaxID=2728841 RepID=UPI00146C3613|nr:hypothetical protein [Pseudoflavitalea sp. G-6-1-2]NML21406.1 hypothetical protein [Pseudoflavitalea sp. G-6-1-2]
MPDTPVPFELHITTVPLSPAEIPAFTDFCIDRNAKPLLIELERGEFIEQPMFNKVVVCANLQEALIIATSYSEELIEKSWLVKRLKIEIPAYCFETWKQPASNHQPYFEWHGKIKGEVSRNLQELCEQHKAHLSLNALNKKGNIRFITLREFGSRLKFEKRVHGLIQDIHASELPLLKHISEYCVYDNNVFLDNGWLPSPK